MDRQAKYVERLSAQIVEWDAQIDLLKNKADRGTPEAASEYSTIIYALQLRRDYSALVLQGIAPTTADALGDIATGSENVMGEIRTITSDSLTKIH
jgi:hypothetical protein